MDVAIAPAVAPNPQQDKSMSPWKPLPQSLNEGAQIPDRTPFDAAKHFNFQFPDRIITIKDIGLEGRGHYVHGHLGAIHTFHRRGNEADESRDIQPASTGEVSSWFNMVTSLSPKSLFVRDETIIRPLLPITPKSTLYYQYAEHRLESLEERVRHQLKVMRQHEKANRDFDVASARKFLLGEREFIDAIVEELEDS